MSDDPFGLSGGGIALSDETLSGEESSDDEGQEVAQAAGEPANEAPPAPAEAAAADTEAGEANDGEWMHSLSFSSWRNSVFTYSSTQFALCCRVTCVHTPVSQPTAFSARRDSCRLEETQVWAAVSRRGQREPVGKRRSPHTSARRQEAERRGPCSALHLQLRSGRRPERRQNRCAGKPETFTALASVCGVSTARSAEETSISNRACLSRAGTDNARTLDVPFRTTSYLLANNSKQRKARIAGAVTQKPSAILCRRQTSHFLNETHPVSRRRPQAIETSTGTRIYIPNEPRDAKDKAPVRVTLVGDDTACNEAERRIVEASALSARFVEKVIHCKAHQVRCA